MNKILITIILSPIIIVFAMAALAKPDKDVRSYIKATCESGTRDCYNEIADCYNGIKSRIKVCKGRKCAEETRSFSQMSKFELVDFCASH